jgi:hypothetical protein
MPNTALAPASCIAPLEGRNSILQTAPLDVAAPLRINVDAADVERALAPRRELQKRFPALIDVRGGPQVVERRLPAIEITVTGTRHPFLHECQQWRTPLVDSESGAEISQLVVVEDHQRIATIDTKLK